MDNYLALSDFDFKTCYLFRVPAPNDCFSESKHKQQDYNITLYQKR